MAHKTFQHNITTLYGDVGRQWLEDLPLFLKHQELVLDIRTHKPFKALSYNYVAPVTLANGFKAVFKCGVPNAELNTEIEALKHFSGHGAVDLIASDAEKGWLLLERLVPGTVLATLENDDKATQIASQVMQALWRPIKRQKKSFPTVEKWLQVFDRLSVYPFSKDLVACAKKTSKALLQSRGELVLLHGDVHHCNILSATREPWLVIDPKGVVGEREFEVGAFMKNPRALLDKTRHLKKLFARRIDIIADITGLDRERMLGWSFVVAMLSACWDYEGHGRHNKLILHCAENLRELL